MAIQISISIIRYSRVNIIKCRRCDNGYGNSNFHLRINLKKIADCSPENFRFHAYVTKDLE